MYILCRKARRRATPALTESISRYGGGLIAAEKADEAEIAAFIGLDGLHYLSIEGMVQATGIPRSNFCLACYTGDYPLPPPKTFGKFCFEGHNF